MDEEAVTAEKWTVVTVTVATDDGTEAGTCKVNQSGNYPQLEDAIKIARDEAFERYGELISENMAPAYRVIAHIDSFPDPQIRETRIITVLPEARPDEPITSQVL